jgi:hypothetical protein
VRACQSCKVPTPKKECDGCYGYIVGGRREEEKEEEEEEAATAKKWKGREGKESL